MTLPDKSVAERWRGRNVQAADGQVLGRATSLLADDATQVLEWVAIELYDGTTRLAPLTGAIDTEDGVRVNCSYDQVTSAPVTSPLHVDVDDERTLYDHYGIAYSTETSPTGLPAAEDPAIATETPTQAPTEPPERWATASEDVATETDLTKLAAPSAAASAGGAADTGTSSADVPAAPSEPPPGHSTVGGLRDNASQRMHAAAQDAQMRRGMALAGAAVVGVVVVLVTRPIWRRIACSAADAGRSVLYATHLRTRPLTPAERAEIAAGRAQLAARRAAFVAATKARHGVEVAAPALAAGSHAGAEALRQAGQQALEATATGAGLAVMAAQRATPAARRLGSAAAETLVDKTSATTETVAGKASAASASLGKTAAVASGVLAAQAASAADAAKAASHRVASSLTDAVASSGDVVSAATEPVVETAAEVRSAWHTFTRRVTLLAGLGAGYVLGARAGRGQYEAMKGKARDLLGLASSGGSSTR